MFDCPFASDWERHVHVRVHHQTNRAALGSAVTLFTAEDAGDPQPSSDDRIRRCSLRIFERQSKKAEAFIGILIGLLLLRLIAIVCAGSRGEKLDRLADGILRFGVAARFNRDLVNHDLLGTGAADHLAGRKCSKAR